MKPVISLDEHDPPLPSSLHAFHLHRRQRAQTLHPTHHRPPLSVRGTHRRPRLRRRDPGGMLGRDERVLQELGRGGSRCVIDLERLAQEVGRVG